MIEKIGIKKIIPSPIILTILLVACAPNQLKKNNQEFLKNYGDVIDQQYSDFQISNQDQKKYILTEPTFGHLGTQRFKNVHIDTSKIKASEEKETGHISEKIYVTELSHKQKREINKTKKKKNPFTLQYRKRNQDAFRRNDVTFDDIPIPSQIDDGLGIDDKNFTIIANATLQKNIDFILQDQKEKRAMIRKHKRLLKKRQEIEQKLLERDAQQGGEESFLDKIKNKIKNLF